MIINENVVFFLESGLLLYLRTSSVQEVRAGIHEMRGLIQLRNQLVKKLKMIIIKNTYEYFIPIKSILL